MEMAEKQRNLTYVRVLEQISSCKTCQMMVKYANSGEWNAARNSLAKARPFSMRWNAPAARHR
jgi:hypothetical protein